MGLFEGKFQFGVPAEARPYLPSHAAHALHKSELVQPPEPVSDPGLLISNGQIGGASNGGAVSLAGEEWGFDYVAAEGDSRKLYLRPSEKDAVEVDEPQENVGTFKQSGMPILTHGDLIVVPGIITINRWRAEQARYQDARVAQVAKDLWSIMPMFPARAEILDVDSSGVTTARWLSSW